MNVKTIEWIDKKGELYLIEWDYYDAPFREEIKQEWKFVKKYGSYNEVNQK